MNTCLNCGTFWSEDQIYCSECGQKIKYKLLTLGNIIRDFLNSVFNLESRFFATIKDIWIPAKLTLAYIAGKRKKYYNPIRIFIVSLFSFFGVLVYNSQNVFYKLNEFSSDIKEQVWQNQTSVKLDSLSKLYQLDRAIMDTITAQIFKPKFTDESDLTIKGSSNFSKGSVTFNLIEVFEKPTEQIIEEQKLESPFTINGLKQIKKMYHNPSESSKFILRNSSWAIVPIVLLFAFIYYLLYIRHSMYYAEHLVFHLYGHARFLFLLTGHLVTIKLGFAHQLSIGLWMLVGVIYLFLSMKVFYQQSNWVTFLKLAFSIFSYLFLICTFILLIPVVTFYLY